MYYIDNNNIVEITGDSSKQGGPDAGFTQRSTLDDVKKEIFVLSGLMKVKSTTCIKNCLWMYSIKYNNWKCIYQNDNTDPKYWEQMNMVEPCPRFAHQFVYNPKTQEHFLFGGNPGESAASPSPKRLDDFWNLKLKRLDKYSILRKCKFLCRRQEFKELTIREPNEAVKYLQSSISECISHKDPTESFEFRKLAHVLISPPSLNDLFTQRLECYEELIQYLPASITQPESCLSKLLALE